MLSHDITVTVHSHLNAKVAMIPTFSSLMAPAVVVMATYGTICHDKVNRDSWFSVSATYYQTIYNINARANSEHNITQQMNRNGL